MIKAVLFAGVSAALLSSNVVYDFGPSDAKRGVEQSQPKDRVARDARSLGAACRERAWPYYESTCLYRGSRAETVAKVRIVSADRLPSAQSR